MKLSRLVPVSALLLTACGDFKLPFGDDEDKAEEGVASKVIEAPPTPMGLFVTSATINVMTVKDGEVEVPGRFTDAKGKFSFDDGALQQGLAGALTINLGSWDSGLELRDTRVKDLFFQVVQHPTATFTLDGIDGVPAEGVAIGHEVEATATGTLYMGGSNTGVEARVKLSRSGEKEFHIDTLEPFVVSIESVGMVEPLKELMRVCEHKSIDDSVKVSVRLDLGPEGVAPEAAHNGEKVAPKPRPRTGIRGKVSKPAKGGKQVLNDDAKSGKVGGSR